MEIDSREFYRLHLKTQLVTKAYCCRTGITKKPLDLLSDIFFREKTLLGHKDIALTERYSHLSNERLRKSTEVLDSIL